MSETPRRHPFARGDRFGVVDVLMLAFPVIALLTLFLPASLETFYWAPMQSQQGSFVVERCEHVSDEDGTYRCVGDFLADDGSEPITRAPHTFDNDDRDEFLYAGDQFPATLYANDEIRETGEIPHYYYPIYALGMILGIVGIPIVISYLWRWRKRRKADRAPAVDPVEPSVSYTGATIRSDGWDQESPFVARSRYNVVTGMLVVATLISLAGFGTAAGVAIQQQTASRTEGTIVIDGCVVQPYFDSSRRQPVVSCEGQFLPYATDDPLGAGGPVAFDARSHKLFEPGEQVRATVYPDGTLIEEAPFDLPGNTALLIGVVVGAMALLLLGVWWLNRLAQRKEKTRMGG